MNRERSLVYIGVSVAIAVVVLLFLARPAYQDMLTSKSNLDDARKKEQDVASQLADTKDLIKNYSSTPQEKITDLNEHIPDSYDEADVIAQLESVGKATHALITSIRFNVGDSAAAGKTIFPLNVTLVATGNYKQLNDLIGSLEQNKRIFNLGNTSFSTSGSTLASSITFTTYFSKINKPLTQTTVPSSESTTPTNTTTNQ